MADLKKLVKSVNTHIQWLAIIKSSLLGIATHVLPILFCLSIRG
jgi:hypothetical protein